MILGDEGQKLRSVKRLATRLNQDETGSQSISELMFYVAKITRSFALKPLDKKLVERFDLELNGWQVHARLYLLTFCLQRASQRAKSTTNSNRCVILARCP